MSTGIDDSWDTVEMLAQRRPFQVLYGRVMADNGVDDETRRRIHGRVKAELQIANRSRERDAKKLIKGCAAKDPRTALSDERLEEAKVAAREALMLCGAPKVTPQLVARITRVAAWLEQLETEAKAAAGRVA
ncbi:MAG: hypothetical protein ACRC6L_12945 [Steroidobacteraceae bacterium]